jgi:energy-coupling factor transport system substrate-specific component
MLTSRRVALLGVLAALNAIVRLMGAGVAGIETAFAVIVLAGYVFGARFGFSLGLLSILASAVIGGGIGPWLPFQLIGAGLVGAGAGLLPRASSVPAKLTVVSIYSVLASYCYGIFLTAWTWPLFVGPGTSISFLEGAPLLENISRFVQFEIVSGGLLWDTGRAITTVALIVLTGRTLILTLERVTSRPDFSKTA